MRYIRARALAAVAAAASLALIAPAQMATAGVVRPAAVRDAGRPASDPLPYTDPGQAGLLTLCNTNLQPITHGNINTKPFVWRAVGAVPAPKGYRVKGEVGILFGYQPRQYTPAGAWSGLPMAAASVYTNPDTPMAQFTPIDEPLSYLTKFFPPIWDNLIELRLYLGGPGLGEDAQGYAAADLRISGNTWTMVEGGDASCTSGSAVSDEVSIGLKGAAGKPKSPSSSGKAGQSGSGASGSGSQAGSSSGSGGAAGSETTAAGHSGLGSAGLAAVIGFSALAAALVLTTGGLWWRRRRRAGL
jgi:uncharacterized membrane protein YgcG